MHRDVTYIGCFLPLKDVTYIAGFHALKGNSGVILYVPTKFGADWIKDLGDRICA